jgi:hypothetical protein
VASHYARSLAVFAGLGLGAAAVQGVHAQIKRSPDIMSGIEMAAPAIYAEFLPRTQSSGIDGPNSAAAERPVTLFRVAIVVHGIISDWNDTFVVDPEYPSFEKCESARSDLVEDFLQILKRRYLQPFNIDSKCVRADGDV